MYFMTCTHTSALGIKAPLRTHYALDELKRNRRGQADYNVQWRIVHT